MHNDDFVYILFEQYENNTKQKDTEHIQYKICSNPNRRNPHRHITRAIQALALEHPVVAIVASQMQI